MYDTFNTIKDHKYIPQEAFLYFPKGQSQKPEADDFKNVYKKQGIKRLIFQGGLTYTKKENQKIEEFRQFLANKGLEFDKRWTKPYIYKFLQSAGGDHKKAAKQMQIHTEYQNQLAQSDFEELRKKTEGILNRGPFYTVGRDSKFRPIVVCDIQKIHEMKLSEDQMESALKYFIQFIYRNMLINGQVESLICVIEIGSTSPYDLMKPMKQTIGFMQNHYKYKLHSAYIFRATRMFEMIYSVARQFMKEDTIRKVKINDSPHIIEDLVATCHPSQFEKKFGGTLPDLQEGEFWPPKIPSLKFENPKAERNIISIEEYRQKFKDGKLSGRKIYRPYIAEDSELESQIPMLNQKRPSLILSYSIIKETKEKEKQVESRNILKRIFSKVSCGGCVGKGKEGKQNRRREKITHDE